MFARQCPQASKQLENRAGIVHARGICNWKNGRMCVTQSRIFAIGYEIGKRRAIHIQTKGACGEIHLLNLGRLDIKLNNVIDQRSKLERLSCGKTLW